ncbi:hypothetical protein SISSUDRAFT_1036015 [Sistotremastrum suecicum HHB10207 ss-3]|uniref:Clavaminate synthase-like protein n=1 Tax=Sistotremastrum suecicum HHB10207 ss-3 TaxID=1314776 RepID=A0A166A066_9AGAM|nr:hypothetical protein SISSUDRAFT_1036015 [Sistotremastrum suecicum HHB10207 ss-3]
MTTSYALPPGPPPGTSFAPFPSPKFPARGWDVIQPPDALHDACENLFYHAAKFFAEDTAYKKQFALPTNTEYQASEEGWSEVPTEKQLLTLRTYESPYTPREPESEIREAARDAWKEAGWWMHSVVRDVVEPALGLPEGVFDELILPCVEMPASESVASLLRMFRYERPPPGADEDRGVVSETHKDLGLMSLVIGHSPGLEVWNPDTDSWFSVEDRGQSPGDRQDDSVMGAMTATLVIGQTLQALTNGRFVACRHRVRLHPSILPPASATSSAEASSSAADELASMFSPNHRYSLVFTLRAHLPTPLYPQLYSTPVTGQVRFPDRIKTAGDLYKHISGMSWNVNINVEERRKQEEQIKKRKTLDPGLDQGAGKAEQQASGNGVGKG